ncbi:amino acid transmembrane transporter protein [Trichomonas vaginalis G3]|nr:amino acid transmembrane transporter protein [Trichomonas vaginalis G3]XP_001293703.2 amino acid transmembrane transporter protein [Trichomonas vaginalis G3]KAI5494997.1 amino acid transmembrane transporter protein [Trichomonas vaginalis G3]KAI5506099.1 amino acid transmembrane transporter protein [Trichomonas vaginalis G3]
MEDQHDLSDIDNKSSYSTDTENKSSSIDDKSDNQTINFNAQLFEKETTGDQSMFGAFVILINTAIGSGCLMVPYCYRLGIVSALLIAIIIGIITFSTFTMMIEAAFITKKYDFRGLFTHLFNPKFIWVLDLFIFLVQIGSVMIYSNWDGVLVNRTLGLKIKVLNSDKFWNFATTLLLAFPMTIPKSIAKLEIASSVGFLLILILISHSLYWLIKDVKEYGFDPNKELTLFHWDILIFIPALGINTMSYNCIINLFPTLEHLRNCTVKRGITLSGIIITACFFLYATFGICTYLDKFDLLSASSALELYPAKNPFTIVATVCVIFILLVSSPLMIWAARNSVDATLFKGKEMTNLRWILTGFILCLLSAGLAATSSNILIFFNIVGGILIPVVTLLFPALFFMKATPNRKWYRTVQALISILFTVIAAVACTAQTALEIKNSSK